MSRPSFRLEGKVALVTGGSRGLGRAIALGFAASGADVVVASRKEQECDKVAAEIRARGGRAVAIGAHVGDWEACAKLVSRTVAELGGLDVLVNNAGIAPVPPSLGEISEELFDKTIGVNLKGPMRLTGLAADHLPAGGSVINISSTASTRPSPHTVVYAAAKAGLNAFTVAAAQELGPRGIRVNTIVCGSFRTDSLRGTIPTPETAERLAARIALRRIGTPEEIVGTAIYLASDASAYMTGALLALDGGVP